MKATLLLLFCCLLLAKANQFVNFEKRLNDIEVEHAAQIKGLKEDLTMTKEDLACTKDALAKITNKNEDLEARVAKLEELSKVNVLRSCAEYSQFGFSASGLYMVDPDGLLLGKPPFQVYKLSGQSTRDKSS